MPDVIIIGGGIIGMLTARELHHAGVEALDMFSTGRLDFEPPDLARFPCLRLAQEAWRAGGSASTLLNAANEIAVEAFLAGRLAWVDISDVIESVLAVHDGAKADTLDDIMNADAEARRRAAEILDGSSLARR